MGQAFVYQGSPRDYPFGHVDPGAVAFFEGRPPDEDWAPHVPAPAADEEPVGGEHGRDEPPSTDVDAGDDQPMGGLRQPNKAASAEDWKAYAAAHGGFQEVTGTHPDDATRRAIVEHYTGEPDEGAQP
jgi:hypothetical protein